MSIIGMQNTHVIAINPCKANIMYSVSIFDRVETTFRSVVERLHEDRNKMPRMLVYARTYKLCGESLNKNWEVHLLSQKTLQT